MPVAEIGDEDYLIVRHTHDIEDAKAIMATKLVNEGLKPDEVVRRLRLHQPVQVWVRIVPALPNSWAASEGLRYTFNPAEPGSPGAFRAVEFR